jgi:hypothetical protein
LRLWLKGVRFFGRPPPPLTASHRDGGTEPLQGIERAAAAAGPRDVVRAGRRA